MVGNYRILVIVPARGGSKSIPYKNIQPFAGHPLIAYSIATGLAAHGDVRVIVSTDDEKIAAVAREYGAELPFMRPSELAQDNTTDLPVFQHALNWLFEHEGYKPDVVIQLRPTSPVRPPNIIDQAVELLMAHPEADSVRGVVPSGQNPYKMWRIDSKTNHMTPLLKVEGLAEPYNAPRQSLPPTYWQTGHIDAIRPATILEKNSMSGDVIVPLVLDGRYTVDIDNPIDLKKAEWLVQVQNLDMVYPGRKLRPLPENVELVVFDFDGVLTDNRVWVDEEGHEQIAANRSDSLGLKALREAGIKAMVLSMETNPVVAARCRKIKLPVIQGVNEKSSVLRDYLTSQKIDPGRVIYVGNDTNDLPCFSQVACAVAVADAQPAVIRQADLVLTRAGGHGAVRELCDILVCRKK